MSASVAADWAMVAIEQSDLPVTIRQRECGGCGRTQIEVDAQNGERLAARG